MLFRSVMKHMINLYYLFNIAGVNQMWEYGKHEFLDIRENRSIVGGFFTWKVRSYWPLLLRMWLGVMWFFEGLNKVGEGWFAWSAGSKSGWMFSSGVVQASLTKIAEGAEAVSATTAATAAVDPAAAVSAATGVVETVTAVTAATGAAAAGVAEATATAFAKYWDLSQPIFSFVGPVSTWFRTTFMDGMFAYLPFELFQLMIVVVEILIGLALFGGFFTWFAAVASIGLCVIFTLSGMFAWNQLWFVFAGILMMGGAGRAFGMDYWSVPLFKRWWNGTKLARRTHLYADDPTK